MNLQPRSQGLSLSAPRERDPGSEVGEFVAATFVSSLNQELGFVLVARNQNRNIGVPRILLLKYCPKDIKAMFPVQRSVVKLTQIDCCLTRLHVTRIAGGQM